MKNLKEFIFNESSELNEEGKVKNTACINISKVIDKNLIDKITSDDSGINWKIYLKPGNIDLFQLANVINNINRSAKYDCIRVIKFNYDSNIIEVE